MASSSAPSSSSSLVAFGSNYYHALGGTTDISLSHESDGDVKAHRWNNDEHNTITSVVCTATATIFLSSKGKVYQSGTLHGMIYPTPTQVEIALPLKCVEVAAGRHFCIGRMEGGLAVVSWGAGHFGQLGQGPHISSLEKPRVMEHLLPHNVSSPVKQVAAGAWHALALLESGKAFGWGSNRRCQCGIRSLSASSTNHSVSTHGSTTSDAKDHASSKSPPPTVVYPRPVETHVKFSKLTCGKAHSVGFEQDTGKVYTWGASHVGQCGHYSRKSYIAPPRLVEALQRVVVVDIAAGDSHTLALTGGGRVFSWGSGLEGQLGLGPAVPLSRPKLIGDLDFVAIAAGQEWKQQQKQRKDASGYTASPPFPPRPNMLDDETIGKVPFMPSLPQIMDASMKQTASQEGIELSPSVTPTSTTTTTDGKQEDEPKHALSTVPKITAVYAAGSYSVAVSSVGHVYTWGYNDTGVLGLPRPTTGESLPFVEPPMTTSKTSGRMLQVRTFDSRHNLLLPRRVDALSDQVVEKVGAGSSHLWVMCKSRHCTQQQQGGDDDMFMVGRTLYEVQEERRRQGLLRMRKHLSTGGGGGGSCSATQPQGSTASMENESSTSGSFQSSCLPTSKSQAPKREEEEEEGGGILTATTTEETNEQQEARPQSPPTVVESADAITTTTTTTSSGRRKSISKLIRKLKNPNKSSTTTTKEDSPTSTKQVGRARKVVNAALCKFGTS